MVEEKKKLRLEIKRQLSAFDQYEKNRVSSLISKNLHFLLKSLGQFHQNKKLAAYTPLADEVLWYLSFSGDEFRYLFPRVSDEHTMKFVECALNDIRYKSLGHSLPSEILGAVEHPDIILVPGMVFTPDCHRMGRGAGFYDRHLAGFEGLTVGVAQEIQMRSQIPMEGHDQHLDAVVTDKTIFYTERLKALS